MLSFLTLTVISFITLVFSPLLFSLVFLFAHTFISVPFTLTFLVFLILTFLASSSHFTFSLSFLFLALVFRSIRVHYFRD